MYCVIMAGGRGTRFWPSSRIENPKQLLNIVGNTSMLQMTVDRLKKMKNVEDIFTIGLNIVFIKKERSYMFGWPGRARGGLTVFARTQETKVALASRLFGEH